VNTKTQKKLDYQIYQSVVYAAREQNSVDAKIKEEIKKAETKRKRNAN
jgi:aspartate/glutamate racemase